MITYEKEIQVVDGVATATVTFYGLSTDDPKPAGAANGSAFIEMDTGKLYFYDASDGGSGWTEWGA